MKVAIIVRRLNVKGGTQRQALELGLMLKKLNHSVDFYTFKYSPDGCYEEFKDFPVIQLNDTETKNGGFLNKISYLSYFIGLYNENVSAKKLANLISRDTDVLNPHDQLSYRVSYFFKKKINKNCPSIWMMNDLPTKHFSYIREKENDSKYEISLFKKFLYYLVDLYDIKKYISSQDVITVLDNRDRDWVREFFNKEAVVVRSGLKIDKFVFNKRESVGKELSVLSVGVLLPHRRFEDVINAVYMLRNDGLSVAFNIIGDINSNPKYYKKLKDMISRLGLEKEVCFLDKVSEGGLLDSYKNSDVLVFPCHLQSWGLAVFEAMASGLPVVVSKTSGAGEVLSDGNNALLVDPKNPSHIYSILKRLVSDNELYSNLSKNGRSFVENNISWDNYANKMIDIFQSKI